jgi:hypothetical protein
MTLCMLRSKMVDPLFFVWIVLLDDTIAQRSVVGISSPFIKYRELKDTNQATKNAVTFLFGGIAVVGGLMVITYVVSLIMDKISPSTGSSVSFAAIAARRAALEAQMQNAPDGEDENRLDRGPLSRKANLWGLHMFERELILKKVFPAMSFDFDVKEISAGTGNIPEGDTCGDIEMSDSLRAKHSNENEPSAADVANEDEQPSATGELDENIVENAMRNVTDHYRMCCICLAPYENGIRVITGAQCKHMFHDTCCQRWLLQHDHCPYCRKEMILPTDFRNAAIAVLGKDRVEELSVTSAGQPSPSQVPGLP